MKHLLLIILCFVQGVLLAQTQDTTCVKRMSEARKYMQGYLCAYDPAKAFKLYHLCALEGNIFAMTEIGNMYLEGTGISADPTEALHWFERAGESGSPQGWYRMGLMYKLAQGVPQDFEKSYSCFEKATSLGSGHGMLFQGEQLYKGLGCKQNYTKAYELFQQGAGLNIGGCMYMLGLCLRNGYGTLQDTAAGNRWLKKAKSKGYAQAGEELQLGEPENKAVKNQLKTITVKDSSSLATYRTVKHKVTPEDMNGTFSGYLITYDWSGQYAVQQTPLKLKITVNDKSVSGEWKESDTLTATLNGILTDTSLLFHDVKYRRTEHYHHTQPLEWLFRNANLKMVKDTQVCIAGNIYFYLPDLMEPAKPMYISLAKVNEKESSKLKSVTTVKDAPVQPITDNAINDLTVFPNPFSNKLTISFSLQQSNKAVISFFAINGHCVSKTQLGMLQAGQQTLPVELSVPAGVYVVQVDCGKESKRTIVVKQ